MCAGRSMSIFFKNKFMEAKIFRIILDLIEEIKGTDYEVCLLANSDEFSNYLDFSGFDEDDPQMSKLAKEAICVRAFLLRKFVDGPLLSLDIIKSKGITKSCLSKSSNIDFVYDNFLANVSSIKDEKDWWKTLNEFVNAVQYAVKRKNSLKEIVSRNIA